MTAWTLSILPILDNEGNPTTDAIWTLTSAAGMGAVLNGGLFPFMDDGDTLTFVNTQDTRVMLSSFRYENVGSGANVLECFFLSDGSSPVPSGVTTVFSPSAGNTFMLKNLPQDDSSDILQLDVSFYRPGDEGEARSVRSFGDDNGSISGKLHGNSGDFPRASRASR